MKEIERAIEFLKNEIRYCEKVLGENLVSNDYRRIALQALQEKLDRQENKALTEEEVRELVKNKEPVFYKPIDKVWEECDIEAKWFIADECMLIAEWLQVGNFYKHKPNGGE